MEIFGSSTLKAGIIAKPFFIGVSIFLAVSCVPFFNENALANWLIFFTYVGIIIYLFFLSCIFTKSVIPGLSFGNVMLIIIFLFSCLKMKWVLNISWQKETNVPEINFRLVISPGTAIRYLIGQILLIIFTSGPLCPLVILNTYRHFISRIKLYRNSNNTPAGTFGTKLRFGQEFWFLLLKNFLYCITFGLYFPRDYTGIVKFFAGHIWIEPGSVPELKQKTPVMIENTPEHNITDRQ